MRNNLFEDFLRIVMAPDGVGGGGSSAEAPSGEAEGSSGGKGEAPKSFEDVLGKLGETERNMFNTFLGSKLSAERKKYKEHEEELLTKIAKAENTTGALSQKLQEIEDAKLTDIEKIQKQVKSLAIEKESFLEERKQLAEKSGEWEKRYKNTLVRNDVYSAFKNHELFNPRQTAELFIAAGNTVVESVTDENDKETGEFRTVMEVAVKDHEGKSKTLRGTPAEVFEKWIEQDENLYLLRNSMNSGSGASSGQRRAGKEFYTLPDWQRKVSTATPDERKRLITEKKAGNIIVEEKE
ncbi:MAG: hypothetical protein PF637_05995 [Spirochaetes bacterium]|jgi:hypothetical protein|nr:hypothetical protein [Spirochaetota bacterium]